MKTIEQGRNAPYHKKRPLKGHYKFYEIFKHLFTYHPHPSCHHPTNVEICLFQDQNHQAPFLTMVDVSFFILIKKNNSLQTNEFFPISNDEIKTTVDILTFSSSIAL